MKEGGGSSAGLWRGVKYVRLSWEHRVTQAWGMSQTNPMHKQLMCKPEAWWLIYTGEASPGWTSSSSQIILLYPAIRLHGHFRIPGNNALGWATAFISGFHCQAYTSFLHDRWGPWQRALISLCLKSCPALGSDLGTSQVTSSTPSEGNSEGVASFQMTFFTQRYWFSWVLLPVGGFVVKFYSNRYHPNTGRGSSTAKSLLCA